jgi:hypothetical protein
LVEELGDFRSYAIQRDDGQFITKRRKDADGPPDLGSRSGAREGVAGVEGTPKPRYSTDYRHPLGHDDVSLLAFLGVEDWFRCNIRESASGVNADGFHAGRVHVQE